MENDEKKRYKVVDISKNDSQNDIENPIAAALTSGLAIVALALLTNEFGKTVNPQVLLSYLGYLGVAGVNMFIAGSSLNQIVKNIAEKIATKNTAELEKKVAESEAQITELMAKVAELETKANNDSKSRRR